MAISLPRCDRFHRVIVGRKARRGSLTFNVYSNNFSVSD
jgi:hypothetical protein